MRATPTRPAGTLLCFTLIGVVASCGSDQPATPDPAPPPSAMFADVTEHIGVTFSHHNGRDGTHRYPEIMGGGVALFDFDNDGWLDIFFVNGNDLLTEPSSELTNVLYRNRRDGTFEDVTARAGVGDPGYGQGCCTADYDADGDQDLYVTNFGPDRFYRNNGNGTFTDVTREAGLEAPVRERLGANAWGQSCAFLDVDADGDLDFYLQHYLTYDLTDQQAIYTTVGGRKRRDYLAPLLFPGAPDLLFRNDGSGRYTDVTEAAGVHRPGGRGMGLACVDFDDDRDVDILVANDGMDNSYFQNDGSGFFSDVAQEVGVAFNGTGAVESSMGVDVGDVDIDGLLDVVIPVIRREVFTLYANHGSFFRDVSVQAGLAKASSSLTGFSPNLADFDNDSDLDLYVTCGGVVSNENLKGESYTDRYGLPDLLLVNDGRGRFSDSVDGGAHFDRTLIGRGSAAGDFDNDGDVDLAINNLAGKAVVLKNLHIENRGAAAGNWLSLALHGQPPNRDAIGARVEVTVGERTQTSVVRGEGSYLSVNDRRLHFGLGEAAAVDRVVVRWPNGDEQVLTAIAPNQQLDLEQP